MKRTLQVNKPIQYVGAILLVLILAFTTSRTTTRAQAEQNSVSQAAVSNYQEAQQNSDLSDEEKIKSTIDAYFTLRYEGQRLLQTQDFSFLLADANQKWVQKEKDKREIELYIASIYQLNYLTYKYNIVYLDSTIDKDQAIIRLLEGHEVVFAATAPEISKMANLEHVFTLTKTGSSWIISGDQYNDELSQLLNTQTKQQIIDQVNEQYAIETQQTEQSRDHENVLGESDVMLDSTAKSRSLTTQNWPESWRRS
jgi:hypothetical protein